MTTFPQVNFGLWWLLILFVCFTKLPAVELLSFDDNLQTSTDLIVEDLVHKYIESHEFWETFSHGTGEDSREVIQVDKLSTGAVKGDFLQWKHSRIGLKHFVIGLQENSLIVFNGGDLNNPISSFATEEKLIAITVFSRWNDETFLPEIIVAAITAKPSINVYRIEENSIVELNTGLPLHKQIIAIESSSNAGRSTKLVLIPGSPNESVDIYNIAINGSTAQIWYHQRLNTRDNSKIVVHDVGPDSLIAISENDIINIYKFDSIEGKYVNHKAITTATPSINIVSLNINFRHFLVAVPKSELQPLEFFELNNNENEKVSFGNIHAVDVTAVNADSFREEQLLVTRSSNGNLKFFSFFKNEKAELFHEWNVCTTAELCTFHGSLSKGVSFIENEKSVFLLPKDKSSSSARSLIVSTSIQETLSPLHQQSQVVFSDVKALSDRYINWEKTVGETQRVLQNALSITMSNVLVEPWAVGGVIGSAATVKKGQSSNSTLRIGRVFNDFTFIKSKWNNNDFDIKLTEIQQQIQELQRNTELAAKILNNHAIPLHSETTEVFTITAAQKISGSITSESLKSERLNLFSINGQNDLSKFLANIVLNENSITLKSLNFKNHIASTNLQTVTLNGINMNSVARLSEKNVFSCALKFQTPLKVDGNIITNTVNGKNFKTELITINDINGVTFIDGLVSNSGTKLSSPVDTITITKSTFDKLLLKSVPQKVSARYFLTDVQTTHNFHVFEINGHKLTEKVGHIVTQSFAGTISGHKIVQFAVDCNSVFVEKTLNGLQFPDSFIFASQKKIVLNGNKTFSRVSASRVAVDGFVEGLKTSRLMSRLGSGTILRNTWKLEGPVQFRDEVKAFGFVDGVKLEELKHQDSLNEKKSTYNINADVEFLQPVKFNSLTIDSTINGKTFNEIFGGILTFDGLSVHIKRGAIFQQSVKMDSLNLASNSINGYDLNNFFTVNSAQTISGTKIIESGSEFLSSLHALSKFDSVDLSKFFDNTFLTHRSRVTGSDLHFEAIACSAGMNVIGKINDFRTNFANLVAVTSGREKQTFKTAISFNKLQASIARIGNLRVASGLLGGLNLESWMSRRLSLSNQDEISSLEVLGNVQVHDNILTSKLNNIALTHLATGVLRTDVKHQVFSENIATNSLIKVANGKVTFERKVGEFDLEDFFLNAFPIESSVQEQIKDSWAFEDLIANDMNVAGLTCGVDLERLNADIVRKGESFITILGRKTFILDLETNKAAKLHLVNEEDIFSKVFTLNTEQTIFGLIQFSQDLTGESGFLVRGQINNISLEELSKIYSFDSTTNTHTLKYNVESEGSLQLNALNIANLVQGTNILDFIDNNVVKISDTNVRIFGEKIFSELIDVTGNIKTTNLNSIDVTQLAAKIARRSSQVLRFTKPVTFNNNISVKKLLVENGNVQAEELSGLNLAKLVAEAVKLNSVDDLGNTIFESIVVLQDIENVEKLNGISLNEIISTNSIQDLGNLQVENVVFESDNVNVGGKILDHDINNEFLNTFVQSSLKEQFLQGSLQFDGSVTVKGDFKCLGEVKDKIVTVNENQEIHSQINFLQPIHVIQLETTNLVNGIKIEELVTQALTQYKTEDITGAWVFTKKVTFKDNVEGDSLLDGFDLPLVVEEKKSEAVEAEKLVHDEQDKFDDKCAVVDFLATVMAASPCKLYSIDTHQTILLKRPAQSINIFKSSQGLFLRILQQTGEMVSHRWNEKTEQFEKSESKTMQLGNVKDSDTSVQSENSLSVFEFGQKVDLVEKLKATFATCTNIEKAFAISPFKHCGINYVASISKEVGMTVYTYKGLSGFQVFNSNPIKVQNVLDMATFNQYVAEYDSPVPFFAVLTSTSIEIFHGNVVGHGIEAGKLKSECISNRRRRQI